MLRGARSRSAALAVGLALASFLVSAGPAAGDVVPTVDCVAPGSGTVNVYFGYTNDGISEGIPFGEGNEVVPGIQFQGQPEVFNAGTYERVFRARWNQEAFLSIAWRLNGHTAIATRTGASPTPTCIAGETGPAFELEPTTATISAVVGSGGGQTSSNFEYGAGSGPFTSTPPAILASGQHGLVKQELSGLTPGTTYSYRVVATDEDGPTEGTLETFTTPVLPAPVTPTPTTPTGGSSGPESGSSSSASGSIAPASGPVVPPEGPFTLAVRAASSGSVATLRRGCPMGDAGGVVITGDRAGTATVTAKAGKLTLASRDVALASGRNVVALCLDKAGRARIGAAASAAHPLRALVTVVAQAGTETARGSARVIFPRGGG
jgi:hypothetical protein